VKFIEFHKTNDPERNVVQSDQSANNAPTSTAWQELALRDLTLKGDANAWRLLYNGSFEKVAAYIRWRVSGIPDLIDDVLQETWLTAIKKLSSFDITHSSLAEPKLPDGKEGKFTQWVCGIASHVIQHQLRSRTRYRKRVVELKDEKQLVSPGNQSQIQSEYAEKTERVAFAMAALSEKYEYILRCKYFEKKTVEQIAQDQNTTHKAIESLLARARQAFREQYECDL
jgi:RNA polymerase sigma-70 factor, ECF subfamily